MFLNTEKIKPPCLKLPVHRRTLTLLPPMHNRDDMSEEQRNAPNPLLEDERKNPVYRLGRAVAGFMVIVWAGVLILVFYLVFRFWLN